MTELQGAVALAQLGKVDAVVQSRIQTADMLTGLIGELPGVSVPEVTPQSKHVYWKYPIRIDDDIILGGVDAFAAKLKDQGIFCAPRYIQKPAFMCQIFNERNTFGKSRFPFEGECRKNDPPVVYDPKDYPGTFIALSHLLVLPWNEFYREEHVQYIADNIKAVVEELTK
jgi:dTDP-4-amino-4,6-dideoxygalactose transaminase